jgi:hypothetical protein
MNILARSRQRVEVYKPSNKLGSNEIMRIERYLDASRTNLLFAKGVVLVEGDAEQLLIPVLIKKILGVSLDELGISLINIGSTGFQNIAMLFSEDRVRRNCAIVTDLDASIVPLPDDPNDDSKFENSCRNSEVSGASRKASLDTTCSKNDYVSPFYADYTFEVDFIKENNSYEVIQTVKKEYNQKKKIENITTLLESSEVEIYGKEVLRLADKFGKGWFAIMLSDNVFHLSGIPDYILEAIAFALPTLSNSILISIMKYRLNNLSLNTLEDDKTNYEEVIKEFDKQLKESPAGAVLYFKATLPNDVLTKLINLYNA